MLQQRTATVLRSITKQYIARAVPISSASIVGESGLDVSSATIRNEMVFLENDGYIIRPHHAAGSIPSDKGYRYYVGTLSHIELPLAEKRLIDHLFHQVEDNLEEWLGLAVTLLAQRVQNVAVITMPKPPACKLKHLELVSLQDRLALLVIVLHGAILRQQLINFDEPVLQAEFTAIAGRLNQVYAELPASRIATKEEKFTAAEARITDCLLKIMQTEDERGYEEPYLDGLHYLMNQPEFSGGGQRISGLVSLIEQRKLMDMILPELFNDYDVSVAIGRENKQEAIQDYSVVIGRYGLIDEAVGTIAIIGPTRMPYARTISTIDYMTSMMSRLVADLYRGGTTKNNQWVNGN
ncbi:MAG: heat-inducible transcription repressor HrcA [Dehalococcoidia bacterium]|nr:MAG: heat-inducible transcription repressor HrcA [Dehalococcoidia bacterium]